DAARTVVEHARLVDLRRSRRGVAPVEARDSRPRTPRVQPLEPRARALLPRAGRKPRRAARLLVGTDVGVDGPRARDHRRGRTRDPVALALARDRRRLLARLRGGPRGA